MDNVMTKGFAELSAIEMEEIDGGFGPLFWTGVGVVVAWAADGILISTTGKSGGEWVSTGINTVKSWF